MDDFTIESQRDGEYLAQIESLEGSTYVTVALGDVQDASDGQLTDDEATARAIVSYLLSHQDASDLPTRIEVGDVLAAYPDALEKILALE